MEIFELVGLVFEVVAAALDALEVISWPCEILDALIQPDRDSRHPGD